MRKYKPSFKHLFVKVRLEKNNYKVGQQIKTPECVIRAVERMIHDLDREVFIVLHLNTRNSVVAVEEVAKGSVDCVVISPREVFKTALLCNASSIILMHNHPAGKTDPSEEDKTITNRLIDAGKLLGIEVLDHIVVGNEGKFLSFREKGFIKGAA
ncbi:MAG: hypothetical protein A2252_04245 [Elusimicrobia bacterium RIFOXYA2_FULL_39_19]|nr:MAG: hypothetical protein A2252_04245 [Elusimicrobia bacterium RIFOXYA2_FULL_39_19]